MFRDGGPVARPAAAASTRRCATHPPRTANDFQAVADNRNANFGIGDLTSVVRLPDGRRFFTLATRRTTTSRPTAVPDRSTGSATTRRGCQSGNCFTLLNRAGPGARSWLPPPQQDGSVYWPAASVVVGPRLYVFLNRVVPEAPVRPVGGSAVAAFELPWLAPRPHHDRSRSGRGSSRDRCRVRGGFIYAFSSRRRSCAFCFAGDLYVARCASDQIQVPAAWRYRSGSSWTADPNAAKPVSRDGGQQRRRPALRQRLPARHQAVQHHRPRRARVVVDEPSRPVAGSRLGLLGAGTATFVRARLLVPTGVHLRADGAHRQATHRRWVPRVVQREHLDPNDGQTRRPHGGPRFLSVHHPAAPGRRAA